jgi:hypothetical protein
VAVLAITASTAYARSVPAYPTFQVQQSNPNGYGAKNPHNCLTEYWGEVVNQCSYEVELVFALPIDNDGSHWVQILNLSYGSNAKVNCSVTGLTGDGNVGADGPFYQTLAGPGTTATYSVNVNPGGTIQVNCWLPAIANGEPNGIAAINWAP